MSRAAHRGRHSNGHGSHFEVSPAEYERRRQGHLQRRRISLVRADVASRARPGDLVLEIGCGPGDVLAAVAAGHAQVSFLGVDVEERMIEHARSQHAAPNVEFRLLDLSAETAELRARVVFAIDVLHHVHALGSLVQRIAGCLEPNGVWTVIEPNSRNPYIWLHQERMRRAGLDEAHFRPDALELEATRHGLSVAERSTAFLVPGFVSAVPGPVAWLERRFERIPVLGGSVVYRLVPA